MKWVPVKVGNVGCIIKFEDQNMYIWDQAVSTPNPSHCIKMPKLYIQLSIDRDNRI